MYGCHIIKSFFPITENFMDRRTMPRPQWAVPNDQHQANDTSNSPPSSTKRPSIASTRGGLATKAAPLKRPLVDQGPSIYSSYSGQRHQETPKSTVNSFELATFPRPVLDAIQGLDLKKPNLEATQFDSSAHQDSQNLDTKSKVKRSKYANDEEKREARLKQIRDAMRRSRQRAKDQEYEGTMQIQNLRSRIRVLLSHRTEMMRVIIDSGTLTEEEALRRYPLIEMEQINRLGYSSSLQGVTCAQPSEIDPVTTRSTEHRDTSDKAKRKISVDFLLNH